MLATRMRMAAAGVTGGTGATYTVTTPGAATHNITSLGVSALTRVWWGDGNYDDYSGTAARSHAYAGAGTWTVTIATPANVTTFRMGDNKVTLNSADVAEMVNVTDFRINALKAGTFNSADVGDWRPSLFLLYSMPAGYTGTFNSADVSAWRPDNFQMFAMPAGYAGTFDSADVSAWRPSNFYLSSIPGYVITAGGGWANWSTITSFRIQDNSLSQATVDAILWELYQASATPRTVIGGLINVGGSNAAPSGTYQAAASCPVTVATPGKEIAHELKNDGCAVGFSKWATVTTS